MKNVKLRTSEYAVCFHPSLNLYDAPKLHARAEASHSQVLSLLDLCHQDLNGKVAAAYQNAAKPYENHWNFV